jgi:protease YdgD
MRRYPLTRRVSVPLAWVLTVGLSTLLPIRAQSQDARVEVPPWLLSAIGRVNVVTGAGRRTHCTGTLISPRHVLTASHCLFNRDRDMWVHPSSVHFVAGYARGEYKAHARAVSYQKGADIPLADPPEPRSLSKDWALIELEEPMNLRPVRVRSEPPLPEDQIVRAGYRSDRAHVPSVQQGCTARAVSKPAPLLLHSCPSVHGESGAALLSFQKGDPEIVGTLVAGSSKEDVAPSIAVPVSAFLAAVEEALR